MHVPWDYQSTDHISEFIIPVLHAQLRLYMIPVSLVICVRVGLTPGIPVRRVWQTCFQFSGGRKAF